MKGYRIIKLETLNSSRIADQYLGIVSPASDITMCIVRVTSDASTSCWGQLGFTFSISTRVLTYAQGIELLLCLLLRLLSRIHVEL